MDFEVHCMFILPTELSLFNYDKVKTVLQSVTPLRWFQAAIFYKNFSIHHTSSDNLHFDDFNYKMEENFD